MKAILRLTVFLASFLALTISPRGLRAQEGPPTPPEPSEKKDDKERNRDRGDRMAKRLIEDLGLSEEQAEKFKAVYEEGQKAAQEAMKARDAKIKELLTEEQAKKYDELVRQRPGGQRPGGQGQGGPGGRAGRDGRSEEGDQPRDPFDALRQMIKKLDLTDEQKEKARAVMMEMQGRIGDLIREAQQGGGDREGLRAKMEELRAEVAEKIKPILTPEQAQKLEEMAKKVGKRMLDGMGPRPGGEAGGPGGALPPEEIAKRRLNAIREDLKVIPEVWAVLGEKIGAILKNDADFRAKGMENGKRCRDLMEKGATDEEIQKEIKAWREAKAAHEAELKKMRDDLRELLDLKEEAKLILHGVLD
jgi:periplasmic protein CpxP/Spy